MRAIVCAATVLAALFSAAPAGAATVSVQYDLLTFLAEPGEANKVSIAYLDSRIPPVWQVTQQRNGATLRPGAGCVEAGTTPEATSIECVTAGADAVGILLGDGDDSFDAHSSQRPIPFAIDGGPGNDLLNGSDGIAGGAGKDDINRAVGAGGRPGTDRIDGGDGDDQIRVGGGTNTVTGGAGADLVYANRGDQVQGEAGNDRLRGGGTSRGGPGNDRLVGGLRMFGEAGTDFLEANEASRVLDGGTGNDRVFGSVGVSTLIGGPGRDNLVGGRGHDTIRARDGARDSVSCGRGADSVAADRLDLVAPSGCESVRRS